MFRRFKVEFQFDCNEIETAVFFDSLDDSISEVLKKAMISLEYSKNIDFFSVRNIFRPMIFEIMEEMNLKLQDDTNAVCYILPKEVAKSLDVV
jgi:hypothetical protein